MSEILDEKNSEYNPVEKDLNNNDLENNIEETQLDRKTYRFE
ncbi:hypothetical protein [Mammaliicoccus lentus]|nr:hypothetical protein [Mammaliicoccus lentus]